MGGAGRHIVWGLRLALAAGLFYLAYRVANEQAETAVVIPVLVLVAMGALLATVPPADLRRLVARLEKVSVGPFAFNLLADAQAAAATAGQDVRVGPVTVELIDDRSDPLSTSLLDLRFKLERKLTYIAKHMLGSANAPAFLTIGSLEYDGYLTPSEARTASRIRTLSEIEFATLEPQQQAAFLGDGDKLASNLRARVLFALTRREAEAKAGWQVSELPGGRRPDLLVQKGERGEPRYRVTTVFALAEGSKLLARPIKRLADQDDADVDEKLVVVPHGSAAVTPAYADGVGVVTIDRFKELLEEG